MNPVVFFCLIGAALAVPHSGLPVVGGVGTGGQYPVGELPVVRTGGVPETYKTAETFDYPFEQYRDYVYAPYNRAEFPKGYSQYKPFYPNFGNFQYYPQYPGHRYPFDYFPTGGHQYYPYPTSHYFYPYTAGRQYGYYQPRPFYA